MTRPKIIITVKNGIVTQVASNQDIQFKLLDYDNPKQKPILSDTYEQDITYENSKTFDDILYRMGLIECSSCGLAIKIDEATIINNDGSYCSSCYSQPDADFLLDTIKEEKGG